MTHRKVVSKTLTGVAALALAAFSSPAQADGAPAMWRLADENSEVFLFGTFHVLPAAIEWTTPAFEAAMQATGVTITEADVTSPAASAAMVSLIGKYGMNPPGMTLSGTLGPARAAELERVASSLGVPMSMLEGFRPWLALVSLAAIAMQKAGFDAASGVEAVVLARAAEEGDRIKYFETVDDQIRILASLDDAQMLANFDVTIAQFDDISGLTTRMLNAWRNGDVKGLEADILAPLRAQSPEAFRALIIDRNEAWAKRIDEIMAGEGGYFIAVGAGHLVGADSVLDMLRARGFAVERVQ